MILSHLEKLDARGTVFPADVHTYARIPFDQQRLIKFGTVTHVGCLYGSGTPRPMWHELLTRDLSAIANFVVSGFTKSTCAQPSHRHHHRVAECRMYASRITDIALSGRDRSVLHRSFISLSCPLEIDSENIFVRENWLLSSCCNKTCKFHKVLYIQFQGEVNKHKHL